MALSGLPRDAPLWRCPAQRVIKRMVPFGLGHPLRFLRKDDGRRRGVAAVGY
jgi:hypothetical protein